MPQTSQQVDEISFSSTRTTFQHRNRGWLGGHWQQERIHLLLHLLCPMPGYGLLQQGRGGAQHLPPLIITLFQQSLAPDFPLLPLLEVQKGEKVIGCVLRKRDLRQALGKAHEQNWAGKVLH